MMYNPKSSKIAAKPDLNLDREGEKAKYSAPALRKYGAVRDLTQGGAGSGVDGNMVSMN
jgi:hypothetical protein